MKKQFFIYILASKPYGTLYIGVTSDLIKRIWQHKEKFVKGFTKKYNVSQLVYFEECGDAVSAFEREKALKVWKREWKIRLITEFNPAWKDLYHDIIW